MARWVVLPIDSTDALSPSSAEAFDKLAPLREAGPDRHGAIDPGARTDADATEPGQEGVARSSTVKLSRGTVVGRHVVLERIGAGGMGVVYAAFDPKLDRKIALKLLLGANDSEARERLVREAQAMAMLSHPNVVAVHDVGTMEDQVWLAMEFIDGQTFGAWCRERPRHWSEVLRILQAVGLGLVAAHKEGLVHRDLKPDNVMIGKDSRARIMDFGLARAVNQLEATVSAVSPTEVEMSREWLVQPRTKTGSILGTVPYMSPEQISGARTVDARSDQFAFCVMLWEALYGERPFAGETLVELAINVCDGQIWTPRVGYAVAPRWARKVLIRGLNTDPSKRWPNIAALLAAFDRGRTLARIRSLVILERALGPEHPLIADILNNLAIVHESSGDLAGARSLHERALAIREDALGYLHPNVAQSISNLGVVCYMAAAYADARAYHERALHIREETLNPNHPDIAESLANLAGAHSASGHHAEALKLVKRSLAIRESLGPDHPAVASGLNNLGAVYEAMGNLSAAREQYERALAIDEKSLGPRHPDYVISLSNLANAQFGMGDYAEAKRNHETALSVREEVLGQNHPDVATSLMNLAIVHYTTKAYSSAVALHTRALTIREGTLGVEHPHVAYSLMNLANVYLSIGELRDALSLAERAVAIYALHDGVQAGELYSHFVLAKALAATRGDRDRMLAEAETARDGYQKTGKDAEIAEIQAWLDRNTHATDQPRGKSSEDAE